MLTLMPLFVCASKYTHIECDSRSLWVSSWPFKIEKCNIAMDLLGDLGMCKKLFDKEIQ